MWIYEESAAYERKMAGDDVRKVLSVGGGKILAYKYTDARPVQIA